MNKKLKTVLLSSASFVSIYAIFMVYFEMKNGLQSLLMNAVVGGLVAVIALGIDKIVKK